VRSLRAAMILSAQNPASAGRQSSPAIPLALLEQIGRVIAEHEKWIAQCTNDEGDRYVLACAIEAQARYIVTFNERHFKDADLARWGIRAMMPNDYLWMRYLKNPVRFKQQLSTVADKKEIFLRDMLEGLLRDCPSFAAHMLSELSD